MRAQQGPGRDPAGIALATEPADVRSAARLAGAVAAVRQDVRLTESPTRCELVAASSSPDRRARRRRVGARAGGRREFTLEEAIELARTLAATPPERRRPQPDLTAVPHHKPTGPNTGPIGTLATSAYQTTSEPSDGGSSVLPSSSSSTFITSTAHSLLRDPPPDGPRWAGSRPAYEDSALLGRIAIRTTISVTIDRRSAPRFITTTDAYVHALPR